MHSVQLKETPKLKVVNSKINIKQYLSSYLYLCRFRNPQNLKRLK
ncbi:hypothetical protein KSS87_006887 [Heliosperma pusillum]|nr:hypothetical protein KSS87_006887 [Heliosperma pusillum]KAH9606153.1 hypothetical protein KSS87_006887 [Heliosperma pusillum]